MGKQLRGVLGSMNPRNRVAAPKPRAVVETTPPGSRLHRLWVRAEGKCNYCGLVTNLKSAPDHPLRATIDHYIPISKGGSNAITNNVIACRSCNAAKADMMPADFLDNIGSRTQPDAPITKSASAPPAPRVKPQAEMTLAERYEQDKAAWAKARAGWAVHAQGHATAHANWANTHAQHQAEIERLKEALLNAPQGEFRYHLASVERALLKVLALVSAEDDVATIRTHVERLVTTHLERGERFRGPRKEAAE